MPAESADAEVALPPSQGTTSGSRLTGKRLLARVPKTFRKCSRNSSNVRNHRSAISVFPNQIVLNNNNLQLTSRDHVQAYFAEESAVRRARHCGNARPNVIRPLSVRVSD